MSRILPRPRVSPAPFGSATIANGSRIPPGTMVASPAIDIQQDRVKTVGFNTNKVGSIFLDVRFHESGTWYKLFDGTTSGAPGSIRNVSWEEAMSQARTRVLIQGGGTATMFYGRFGQFGGL